jgi:Arc/MetJ-type ribon-helix-helix transcriptional regulator
MASTEQLTIDLSAELVADLRNSIQSGEFASENEAIERILRTWYGPAGSETSDLDAFRAIVAEGLADADAGNVIEADEVHAELHERIKAVADRGQ